MPNYSCSSNYIVNIITKGIFNAYMYNANPNKYSKAGRRNWRYASIPYDTSYESPV